MLIHLYLLLAAAALGLFVLGLKYGSFGSGAVVSNEGSEDPRYMTKAFMTSVLFLSCMILSFVLSAASYDVRIPHCDSIIDHTSEDVPTNSTNYTYVTSCTYDQYTDDAVGDLFQGLAWISLLMLAIFGFRDISGMVS